MIFHKTATVKYKPGTMMGTEPYVVSQVIVSRDDRTGKLRASVMLEGQPDETWHSIDLLDVVSEHG